MSAEYFEQKPNLDLKPFFETKGIKMNKVPVSGAAPPPKDSAWVAVPDVPKDEEPE